MSAVEKMLATALKALDLPVEEIKAQVTTRIAQFEQNVKSVETALITIMRRQEQHDAILRAIAAQLGLNYERIEFPAPATKENENGHGNSAAQISQSDNGA